MDHPTLVEIQYWNAVTASWQPGHAGINLLNPAVYVQKLAKRGVVARAIDKDTREMWYGEGADLL